MSKIILSKRKTKKVELPESKATVEIYASIIAADIVNMGYVKENDFGQSVKMLSQLIKSWNIYEDEKDEKPREINDDSIGQLPISDLTFLFTELQEFVTSEKKG